MARNKYPEVTIKRVLDVATDIFLEVGYEKTTIQEIINRLGDLSKGAIYHHFKSKEEIIDAVLDRMMNPFNESMNELFHSKNLNALEKMKQFGVLSITAPYQEEFARLLPNFLKNPNFLSRYLENQINNVIPKIVLPLVKEGIEDGSIQTNYPDELAEIIVLFVDVYLNPFIFTASQEVFLRRLMFFKQMMESLGLYVIDDKFIEGFVKLNNAALNNRNQ